jgi:hypothetical protein
MSGRDPLVLARQMAESYLARPDAAKAAGLGPSYGELVVAFMPAAEALARGLDALEDGFGEIGKQMDGVAAKLRLVAEQDRRRREEAAARHARMAERIRDPQGQARFVPLEGERFDELRAALKVAGLAQVPAANGHGAGGA